MSEGLGSILKLQSRVRTLSNVNLLIITDYLANSRAIAASLDAVDINITYDSVDTERSMNKQLKLRYSAIVYDYIPASDSESVDLLIAKLQTWYHLYPDTPLILITDPLGDRSAIKLIQSGISGYVLRNELEQLPNILEKSLFKFASDRAIVKQQQEKIQCLEAEVQTWLDSDRVCQAKIRQHQEKIEQLQALQANWQERERATQEHISYLVHELRNPISAVIGFARGLREQYFGALNPKQMQYASLLVESGEYLLNLVEKYLNITKLDANQEQLEFQPIAVEDVCQSSILMLQAKAQQKELELKLELQPGIDFCTADSSCLKQILINLLSNAIKFTDEGSVTLKVSGDRDWLHFAVIDTGTGISAENVTKLFKPFPQISNHHENTGLGLTLSKKQAQLHGGDITVTSKLGHGSCFTLSIPQQQA